MSTPKPWIVDAAEIHGDNADMVGTELIHVTSTIRDFLSLDGPDWLYVVAPKGYGKTLLLQAKRMLLQQNRKGIILSPSGQLVDRPPGGLPIWTKEELNGFVRSYDYWVEVWVIAIKIASVRLFRHHVGVGTAHDTIAVESSMRLSRLREMLERPQLEVLSELFMQILHLDRREFFALRRDVISCVSPLFRSIHTGLAFFIDNVDECMERSLGDRRPIAPRAAARDAGNAPPEPWTLAQLALARAAFDVNRLNTHVRVYAAIRREAWLRLADVDSGAAQMNGRMVEISYTQDDLLEIFIKNIGVEPANRLCDRHARDPIARFVGKQNTRLAHELTGANEDFFTFILRHTLLRPRELMAIGSRISLIPPDHRNAARLKEVIRRTAAENVRFFQAELGMFLSIPGRSFLGLIDRNVLNAAHIDRIEEEYRGGQNGAADAHEDTEPRPFLALYRTGLLGVVRGRGGTASEEDLETFQRFIRPEEISFEEQSGTLPRSEHYLIHPALDLPIEEAHGIDYVRNSDRHNIIGASLPWVDEPISHFVLVGDIVGSTVTAWHPDYTATYPAMFGNWVTEICERLGVQHHSVTAGDSVLLVDGNAGRLLLAARLLLVRMQRLKEHRRTMRFGAARGVVQGLEQQRQGNAPRPLTGAVLATAARLEKAAKHGTALATDDFWDAARGTWDAAMAARLDGDFKGFKRVEGKFLVQKTKDDPGVASGLWRIRLLDA